MTGTRNMERPSYPNERDCKHGKLRRSCDLCGYESEIKAQQQEINELKKKLNDEENRHAELQSRCFDNGYATGDSIFNENDELKAHVERLREALAAVWNDDSTSLTDRTIRRINTVMIMTPKQSLEAYRNSVIDECKNVVHQSILAINSYPKIIERLEAIKDKGGE